ncbi:hypothetical protein AVEN_264051-1 [Araneus ventricosus]|uniref:CCHC-type domain-containing protein n=1 Tax=Araneus ventricosus TaxID=182803 RepID=A0A4Y2UTE7_ARAVE|nr:hypothetical protein AVEN_264051-1 [Araneus ventricosus]
MVESCFEEEFLKAWNRIPTSSSANDAKERLENLMLFLKGEVEGDERISLAMSGFGLTKGEDVKMPKEKKYNLETQRGKIPTASMLLASTRTTEVKKPKCIFCDGKHVSSDCFNAQKLTLEEKQKIVRDRNCCFACLLPGHSARKCLIFNQDNRYEVCLPWADDSFPLPDNFNLAKKRLEVTTEMLLSGNLYDKYENVFQEWLDEGIIEEVPPNEVALYGNYLPHRPVIKESSSTTPIRPVFDASVKVKKFGATADIRRAFLQISVSKEDRDYLRFLWRKNLEEKKLKVFRHTRVVFGVKSSSFLLASVIEHHIEASKGFDSEFKKILKQIFYVDNVVASLDSHEDLNNFISKSTQLMLQGGCELRDWESTECEIEHGWETPVLGMKWNRQLDSLRVNMSWMNKLSLEKITKRIMLSAAHKVFDPIGYTAPVMLCKS